MLEYIPETVYKVARQYSKQKQTIPVTFIKLYMYQLFRYSDGDHKQRSPKMTNFLSDHWPISTLTESATAISNLRTCSLIQTAEFSSSVTLAAPSILCAGSPMSRTFAPDITGNIRLNVTQHLLTMTSCRAPELIFGATDYTTNIDVWSAGCVFAGELRLAH